RDDRGFAARLVLRRLEIDSGDGPLELGRLGAIAERQVLELAPNLGELTLELSALALEAAQPRALIEQRLAAHDELLVRNETFRADPRIALRRLLRERDSGRLRIDRPDEPLELRLDRTRPGSERVGLGALEQAELIDLREQASAPRREPLADQRMRLAERARPLAGDHEQHVAPADRAALLDAALHDGAALRGEHRDHASIRDELTDERHVTRVRAEREKRGERRGDRDGESAEHAMRYGRYE